MGLREGLKGKEKELTGKENGLQEVLKVVSEHVEKSFYTCPDPIRTRSMSKWKPVDRSGDKLRLYGDVISPNQTLPLQENTKGTPNKESTARLKYFNTKFRLQNDLGLLS